MAVVRTAVLLFAWSTGAQPMQMPDEDFYRRYFFDLGYGQAAYWAKQTDYQVLIEGDVFSWAFVRDDTPDLTSRTTAIEFAIEALQDDRDIDFGGYDMVLLVESVNPGVKTDGGATTVRSDDRSHPGVAIKVGDGFDFVAHEIGHCLGLQHSFGDPFFHADGVPQGGEYGHPYCIMSAQAYGGLAVPFAPVPPRENRPEYTFLGPSLNAATALARGWLTAYDYPLDNTQPAEFVLRSRHYLGPGGTLPPQALNVRRADGTNYVVEYRENELWDKGQGTPVVIVNQGAGSTADAKYPGSNSATFLKQIRIPFGLGGPGGRWQGTFFGLQVLDRDPVAHTVRIKAYPGAVPLSTFGLTTAVTTEEERVVGRGETSFEPGDLVCVDGVWPYTEVERTQLATFECTYDLAVPPVTVTWTIDGSAVPDTDGFRQEIRDVVVADPKLQHEKEKRVVSFEYHVEQLATGSRLTIRSAPPNESFTVAVTATLTTAVGSASDAVQAQFENHAFVYPQEFSDRRWACLIKNVHDRSLKYKVVFPPDGWQRPDPEPGFDPRVAQLVDSLPALLENHDRRGFEQGLVELERLSGVDRSLIRIARLDDRAELARPEPQVEIRLDAKER